MASRSRSTKLGLVTTAVEEVEAVDVVVEDTVVAVEEVDMEAVDTEEDVEEEVDMVEVAAVVDMEV